MLDLNRIRDHSGPWCKICGITRSQDAEFAARAGADALGFNLYPASPRYIPPERAAELAADVGCDTVALLVNPAVAQVEQVIESGCFNLLQFHGDESAQFCASFGVPYIKAIRMQDGPRARRLAELEITAHVDAWAILLDTHTTEQYGGTGQSFDWSSWPSGAHERLVLAGGLTPDNVASAIHATRPFGVDLSSGVEGPVKGVKDHVKIEQFIKETRSARCS